METHRYHVLSATKRAIKLRFWTLDPDVIEFFDASPEAVQGVVTELTESGHLPSGATGTLIDVGGAPFEECPETIAIMTAVLRKKKRTRADHDKLPYFDVEIRGAADGWTKGAEDDVALSLDRHGPVKPKKEVTPKAGPRATGTDLDVFQDSVLRRLVEAGRTSDAARAVLEWGPSTTDELLLVWIDHLPADPGWRTWAAGQLAVMRVVAKNEPSARTFLAVAERNAPATDRDALAATGLVPAWWRLGAVAKANAAYAVVRKQHAGNQELLALIAGLGGRADVVKALGTKPFRDDRVETVAPAIAMLAAEGSEVARDALLARANVIQHDHALASLLYQSLARAGRIADYAVLITAFPELLGDALLPCLLHDLARIAPADAVAIAREIIRGDLITFAADRSSLAGARALAILAAHAPAKAREWATAHEDALAKNYVYLAALGRVPEATAGVARLVAAKYVFCKPYWVRAQIDGRAHALDELALIADVTRDASLAKTALTAFVHHREFVPGDHRPRVAKLARGEHRELVEAYVKTWLARPKLLVQRGLVKDLAWIAGVLKWTAELPALVKLEKSVARAGVRDAFAHGLARGEHWGELLGLEPDLDTCFQLAVPRGSSSDRVADR